MKIGNLKLDNPFILAPLAGYTDLPFRLLCKKMGAGLCVSEMISCHGLFYNQPKTIAMLASVPEEQPVSFQLFGAEPQIMAQAAKTLSAYSPDLIDINMGCPVKKVTKKGAGAAMMKNPQLAQDVIKAVLDNSNCPVTVKFRTGPDNSNLNAVSFGLMAEKNGVAAVTVHGRTWAQGFTGVADWQAIKEVKDALNIPVIGNGDIQSYEQGLSRMEETGCDGVMIGRAALGNPWIFSPEKSPEDISQVLNGVQLHLQLMEEHLPVDRMIGCIKNHIGRYFKNMKGSSAMRKAVFSCSTFDQLKQLIEQPRISS